MKIINPPYCYWERDSETGVFSGALFFHPSTETDTSAMRVTRTDTCGPVRLSPDAVERLMKMLNEGPLSSLEETL
jgi:hypothetical protein